MNLRLASAGLRGAPHVLIFELVPRTELEELLVGVFRKLDHVCGGGAERKCDQQIRRGDPRLGNSGRKEQAIAEGDIGVNI